MKTAFAVLSILFSATPAFAGEFGRHLPRHEVRIGHEIARERGFERFRIARFGRERFLLARDCRRFW